MKRNFTGKLNIWSIEVKNMKQNYRFQELINHLPLQHSTIFLQLLIAENTKLYFQEREIKEISVSLFIRGGWERHC